MTDPIQIDESEDYGLRDKELTSSMPGLYGELVTLPSVVSSVFVRDPGSPWDPGSPRPPRAEVGLLLRQLQPRDRAILLALHQHQYLTSDQIHLLFFRSLYTAQRRLHWLSIKRHLLERWWQLQPSGTLMV